MAAEKEKEIDLTAFDAVKECEDGQWLEFRYGGKETGFSFLVMGRHAQKVAAYETKKTQELARKSTMAEKRKATDELLQELIANEKTRGVDDALVRVVGVSKKGVEQKFEPVIFRQFLEKNPDAVKQIIDFSDDVSVFTKAL